MKRATDPRHVIREQAVTVLFSVPFVPKKKSTDLVANRVLRHRKKIDEFIKAAAPEWSIDKINRIDLAILRLSTWELAIEHKTPPKVIIDEAVELAKEFGAEGSPGFVNGVLGTILKRQETRNPALQDKKQ